MSEELFLEELVDIMAILDKFTKTGLFKAKIELNKYFEAKGV